MATGVVVISGDIQGLRARAEPMTAAPTRHVDPVDDLVPFYRARKVIYRDLYQATRDIHTRLGNAPA